MAEGMGGGAGSDVLEEAPQSPPDARFRKLESTQGGRRKCWMPRVF